MWTYEVYGRQQRGRRDGGSSGHCLRRNVRMSPYACHWSPTLTLTLRILTLSTLSLNLTLANPIVLSLILILTYDV